MRSKNPIVISSIPADVDRVRRRLQEWRRRRKHGSRIPEALWKASAKLATKYGASKVAHALGLDYYNLKQRLNAAMPHDTSGSQPRFIELRSLTPASPCQCSIEIEPPGGGKLKLEFKGLSTVDLAALSRALWSVER